MVLVSNNLKKKRPYIPVCYHTHKFLYLRIHIKLSWYIWMIRSCSVRVLIHICMLILMDDRFINHRNISFSGYLTSLSSPVWTNKWECGTNFTSVTYLQNYMKYTVNILYCIPGICNLSKLISKTIIKSNFTCTVNVMIFILTTDMDHSALMKNILLKCEIEWKT